MLEEFSRHTAPTNQERRPLDIAQGVIMALHRTDAATAFSEMVGVAYERGVTVLALADALIDLVAAPADHRLDTPAHRAARERWGFDIR